MSGITPLSLTAEDRTALQTCNFRTTLVALQLDAPGGPKIVNLSRDQLTCWQLFLKCLGRGKLVNIEHRLTNVARHLTQYQLIPPADAERTSSAFISYQQACGLAERALMKKADQTLWNHVSQREEKDITRSIRYPALNHSGHSSEPARYPSRQDTLQARTSIRYTPFTRGEHLVALLKMQYPGSKVKIQSPSREEIHPSAFLNTREAIDRTTITVKQNFNRRDRAFEGFLGLALIVGCLAFFKESPKH